MDQPESVPKGQLDQVLATVWRAEVRAAAASWGALCRLRARMPTLPRAVARGTRTFLHSLKRVPISVWVAGFFSLYLLYLFVTQIPLPYILFDAFCFSVPVVLTIRIDLIRKALRQRQSFRIVPRDTLELDNAAGINYLTALWTALTNPKRKYRWWVLPATHARIMWKSHDSDMSHILSFPRWSTEEMRALHKQRDITVIEDTAEDSPNGQPKPKVQRCELVIEGPLGELLKEFYPQKETMGTIAQAIEDIPGDQASAEIAIDIRPLTNREWKRTNNTVEQNARKQPSVARSHHDRATSWIADGQRLGSLGRRGAMEEPPFKIQILLCVRAINNDLARKTLQMLASAFISLNTTGRLASGLTAYSRGRKFIPVGNVVGYKSRFSLHKGSNARWRRKWFDFRLHSDCFPGSGNVVIGREITPLVCPVTAAVEAPNVERIVTEKAKPNVDDSVLDQLPDFNYDPKLMPLGYYKNRLVGTYPRGVVWGLIQAGTGGGKSTWGLLRFLWKVLNGSGGLLSDPEKSTLLNALSFLSAQGVAERVRILDFDLDDLDALVLAWNFMDMRGKTFLECSKIAEYSVNAIQVANKWNDSYGNLLAITQRAVRSAAEFNHLMCRYAHPERQITLLQIPAILSEKELREAFARWLITADLRDYWLYQYPSVQKTVSPILQRFNWLWSNETARAVFGQPMSTFDMDKALEEQLIVLMCPTLIGNQQRLLANLVFGQYVQAALKLPETHGDPFFHLFIDELKRVISGTTGWVVPILELMRKRGQGGDLGTQGLYGIPRDTVEAILNAASTSLSLDNHPPLHFTARIKTLERVYPPFEVQIPFPQDIFPSDPNAYQTIMNAVLASGVPLTTLGEAIETANQVTTNFRNLMINESPPIIAPEVRTWPIKKSVRK